MSLPARLKRPYLGWCGAGCEMFEDIYDYACDKEQFLRLPAGIPAYDTRKVHNRL